MKRGRNSSNRVIFSPTPKWGGSFSSLNIPGDFINCNALISKIQPARASKNKLQVWHSDFFIFPLILTIDFGPISWPFSSLTEKMSESQTKAGNQRKFEKN